MSLPAPWQPGGGCAVDREFVAAVLALVAGGSVLMLCGVWRGRSVRSVSGRALEREQWLRLWTPFIVPMLVFAGVLGWAIQEPAHPDESVGAGLALLATVPSVLVLRAMARAIRSVIRGAALHAPALTVGLWRPRILVAAELNISLDPAAVRAAWEHESAHARHHDPLRIWVAQFATDLLWPLPAASDRFRAWLYALEVARDEEARGRGVDGEDLAAAVIEAARLQRRSAGEYRAALIGDGERLRDRIARLLLPLPQDSDRPAFNLVLVFAGGAVVAGILGLLYGDAVVRAFPGIIT
jgi:hypothetical protein